ncbi:C39 family peptidase [Planosporangium mesophilum]|uniref:Peptidase C39-like domain-containing protein n=1 Tax=Planosporangium mesophilum TaxID=689768 RepID=A0A8J3TI85_9ACTN|nr:C39 family peptidase [Planosporangium mesophilum]NJC86570.1 hypothetical protein [Planosporangium mesophilum]GII26237.1 hypothetical protein Pme01_58340 [Planosporangium mesophilum]
MRRLLLGLSVVVPFLLAGGVVAAPAHAAATTLTVTWQQQTHGYNCGPAATRISLSRRLTSLPSQASIGSVEGTSSSTGTYRTGIKAGLDHWMPSMNATIAEVSNPMTSAQKTTFLNRIKSDINGGWAPVVNIVVRPGGPRPPGWSNPSTTIDHWFTVIGYNTENQIAVADPASGMAGFNSQARYWIPWSTMTQIVTKTYVW